MEWLGLAWLSGLSVAVAYLSAHVTHQRDIPASVANGVERRLVCPFLRNLFIAALELKWHHLPADIAECWSSWSGRRVLDSHFVDSTDCGILRRACASFALSCWLFVLCFAEIVKEMTNKTWESHLAPSATSQPHSHFFTLSPLSLSLFLPVNGLTLALAAVLVFVGRR